MESLLRSCGEVGEAGVSSRHHRHSKYALEAERHEIRTARSCHIQSD
jgi:hypothetical protein